MNYQEINPLELPSVTMPNRKQLPKKPGVYFLFSDTDELLYVGISKSLRNRWTNHHICADLDSPKTCRIAYLVTDSSDLEPIELFLLGKFLPPLNINRLPRPEITEPPKVVEDFDHENLIPESFLTIKGFSQKFKIPRATVNLYCRQRRFPNAYQVKTKFGSFWLIPETDLENIKPRKPGRPSKTKP